MMDCVEGDSKPPRGDRSLHSLDLARPAPHPCEAPGCDHEVEFDDEPFCFRHSGEGGAYVRGYSYRRKRSEEN